MRTNNRVHEPTKDPDLWSEDGNTVVIAQDSAFRVHRGLLSRHSNTFSGLFSIPQPTNPATLEPFEGYPAVRVTDSAHDFKCLLQALYDGVNYLKHDKRAEFSDLAAMARLGHKYQLDDLVSDVCGRLASRFSTNDHNFRMRGTATSTLSLRKEDAIEAFNLFSLLGRADMIPVALYGCCQLSIPTLLRGVQRADGTLEQLNSDDLERCLVARQALATSYAWLIVTSLDSTTK